LVEVFPLFLIVSNLILSFGVVGLTLSIWTVHREGRISRPYLFLFIASSGEAASVSLFSYSLLVSMVSGVWSITLGVTVQILQLLASACFFIGIAGLVRFWYTKA